MKNFLFLIILLTVFGWQGNSQVSIGTGTIVDQALPIEPYFGFSYSQSIYLASEINANGSITGLKYFATPSTTLLNSDSVTVYIGHTARTSFTSTTDWEPIGNLTESFVGIVSITGGEMLISLTIPFNYNGTDNLLIAIEEDRLSFDSTNDDFYCSSTPGDRSITYRSDGTNPDSDSPPTATGLRQYIPNIELQGITQTCPAPSALNVSAITATTVDLGWLESGSAATWDVEWGVTNFIQGAGTFVSGTTTNPHTLTGLNANETYEFYVRADCGGTDGFSTWAGPYSFATPCAIYTPNYLEEFATFIPDCWGQATSGSPLTGVTGIGTSSWGHTAFLNSGGINNAVKINLYTDSREDWLLSPIFDLSAGGLELAITAGVTSYNGTASINMGSDDLVQVVMSVDGGSTWSIIHTWDVNNQPLNSGSLLTVDLSAYTGSNTQFAIWATDGSVDDSEDYDFHINDFEIRIPPTCPKPSDLTADNITSSSVDLGWTENGSATSWQIEWGMVGFTQGTGNLTLASNTQTINTLSPLESYDFYVRSICGIGDTSAWVSTPFNFTTPCGIYTPNYLEEFATFIPDCWDQATSGSPLTGVTGIGTSSWGHTDFLNSGGTNNAVKINLYTDSREDWLLSPIFDLSAGGLELAITAGVTSYNGTASINMGSDDLVQVVMSVDGGSTWSIIHTWDVNNQPLNSGSLLTVDLSAYTGSNTQFAIWATDGSVDDSEDYDFHINDFEIRIPIVCNIPTNLSVNSITPVSANLEWTENGSSSWDIEYGETPYVPVGIANISSTPNNPQSITGLTASTEYEFYVRANCGSSLASGWAGPFTFLTTPCISNTGDTTAVACENFTWYGTNYTSSGTPTQTLTNMYGCDSVVTLNLTINQPNTAVVITTTQTDGINLMTNVLGDNYQWIDCDNGDAIINGETNLSFTALENGNYAVIVTQDGCNYVSSCIEVSNVGINSNMSTFGVSIYPNPTEGNIFIKIDNTNNLNYSISLYNLLGEVILTQQINTNTTLLNTDHLENGVYFVEIKNKDTKETYRIVKQ